jgi:prophage DNA circulation protein
MELHIHVHHHEDHDEKLARFDRVLSNILTGVRNMSDALSTVEGQVTRLENLVTGIATELSEIALALNNAMSVNDPARVAAVSKRLDALTEKLLSAGVSADITPETPLEPPVVVEPPVEVPPGETPV